MKNLFDGKTAEPMLIGTEAEAFDDDGYIFELKLDGERCLAYLDRGGTFLVNRRNKILLPKFPELAHLHRQVKHRCILDGELVVSINGKPDFEAVKDRSFTSNKQRIERLSYAMPAVMVAFDILFLDNVQTTSLSLMERKDLLERELEENDRINLSRYVETQGKAFFSLVKQNALEGIVAKRRESLYYMGKRTKEWKKIKNQLDDDCVICGYFYSIDGKVASLVLGQYGQDGELLYKGRVTLGVKTHDFQIISNQEESDGPPFASSPPKQVKNAVWLKPELVCTIRFIEYTADGGFRQPVYKGLRPDKRAREAVVKTENSN